MTSVQALSDLLAALDSQRAAQDFLSVSEVMALGARGTIILDPFSTLISRSVALGRANIFYPNVTLEVRAGGGLAVGDHNRFYPQTFICAGPGQVTIGHDNTFGEGGALFKTSAVGEKLVAGDGGRYNQGACILGTNFLGSGSQVLGQLTVQGCHLEAGEGYRHSDPDARGGVLKGFGTARNLNVGRGNVISGRKLLAQAGLERQVVYHPKS